MGNKNFTALFVEDDENDILLTQRSLRQMGASFARFVRNGIELMDYLKGNGMFRDRANFPLPQVIVTDLKMPQCSGFEVIEWLNQQEAFRKIPVFVLTSSTQEKDIQKARALGVHSYFKKPGDYRELQRILREAFQPWIEPQKKMERPTLPSGITWNPITKKGITIPLPLQVRSAFYQISL